MVSACHEGDGKLFAQAAAFTIAVGDQRCVLGHRLQDRVGAFIEFIPGQAQSAFDVAFRVEGFGAGVDKDRLPSKVEDLGLLEGDDRCV